MTNMCIYLALRTYIQVLNIHPEIVREAGWRKGQVLKGNENTDPYFPVDLRRITGPRKIESSAG